MIRQIWIMAAIAVVLCTGGGAVAQPAAAPQNYVIGPHDRLRLTVWNQADVSGEYTVERDGTFTFPHVGRVTAGGLTLPALELALKALLREGEFYKDPQVTASVIEYRSQRVFVMGELRTPGTYPLTGETSLIEVIAGAGSTTPAAADQVFIIRSTGASGPVLPGQDPSAEVVVVDLRQLRAGESSLQAMVRSGDTVFVPRAANVFVFGQVRNPGAYPIGQGTTVLQALALAGGVGEFGAANRVRIIRVVDEKTQELKVKMNDSVQPGDTIVVPERLF